MRRGPNDDPLTCGDCGVSPGTAHEPGCDVARCMWTGVQAIQCELGMIAEIRRALRLAERADLADALAYHHSLDDLAHDCGEDVWTGVWPGKQDAADLGWFSYFGPPWIRCSRDYPGASPDLNRLVAEGRWDRQRGRWVAR